MQLRLCSRRLIEATCCESGNGTSSSWERHVNWDYCSFGNINGSLSINRSLRSVFTLYQFLPPNWSVCDIETCNRYWCLVTQKKQDVCYRANSDYQVVQSSASKPRKIMHAELSKHVKYHHQPGGKGGCEKKSISNGVIGCKWSKTLNDVGVECMLAHMIIPL